MNNYVYIIRYGKRSFKYLRSTRDRFTRVNSIEYADTFNSEEWARKYLGMYKSEKHETILKVKLVVEEEINV